MTAAGGGRGVEVDVEALRRAAALLREGAVPLNGVTTGGGRALADAGAASGHPVLAAALAELAARWNETAGAVARRVEESAAMLRGSVDAYVTADEAGAGDIGGPR